MHDFIVPLFSFAHRAVVEDQHGVGTHREDADTDVLFSERCPKEPYVFFRDPHQFMIDVFPHVIEGGAVHDDDGHIDADRAHLGDHERGRPAGLEADPRAGVVKAVQLDQDPGRQDGVTVYRDVL